MLSGPWVESITLQNFLESFGELLTKAPVDDGVYATIEEINHLCKAE